MAHEGEEVAGVTKRVKVAERKIKECHKELPRGKAEDAVKTTQTRDTNLAENNTTRVPNFYNIRMKKILRG